MKGLFNLDAETISKIGDSAFGVYLLTETGSKGGTIVVYVGRGDLKDRLTEHAKAGDGTGFYFKTLENDEDAFEEECSLYRKYGKTDYLDNRIAPALPEGSKLDPCS